MKLSMKGKQSLFATCICLLIAAAEGAGPHGNPHQPVPTTGIYTVTVGGFYSGQGTAVVSATKVRIHATVKSDSGISGPLIANNMAVVNDHFSGKGHVHGNFMSITGRLDQIQNVRLSAHFTTSDGYAGHIIGVSTGPPSPDDPLDGE